MNHFAIEHKYGIATGDGGLFVGTIHAFPSAPARDAWIADGPSFRSASGHRTSLMPRAPEVQQALRGNWMAVVEHAAP